MKTSLKYSIEKNNYNNLHYAVIHARTETFHSFIEKYGDKYDAKVLADIYKKLISFIKENIQEGNSIDFEGLFTIQPVIKGKFTGKEDEFEPERHKLDIKISPDKPLIAAQKLDNYKFKKTDGTVRRKK